MRVQTQFENQQGLFDTLDFLYQQSKNKKSFTGILELVLHEQTIITAIHNIKGNKGSKTPGVDGKIITDYLQMPKPKLLRVIRQSIRKYEPLPVRRTYIEKRDSNKKRPLGIPTMKDRIIQECLKIVLEPILEAKFYEHSYGFRPYRACEHAIARAIRGINISNSYWTIEGDIKGFFDNVNHRILLNKLHKLGIIDKRILMIIKAMLEAKILDCGVLAIPDKGTPQGGILSPLLANAYLNDFDWSMNRLFLQHRLVSEKFKGPEINRRRNAQRHLKDKMGVTPKFLTRYADDWIIQTKTEKEAIRLKRWLTKYFKYKLKLELSPEKTFITNTLNTPVKFLGFNITAGNKLKRRAEDEVKVVGKNYPNHKRVIQQCKDLLNYIDFMKKITNEEQFVTAIERLNSKIVGISNYWRSGTSSKTLSRIDNIITQKMKMVLRGKRNLFAKMEVVPISKLGNRPNRHLFDEAGKPITRDSKTVAYNYENIWIGVTRADITHIEYGEQFNQKLSPFTEEGRKLRDSYTKKNRPLVRQPLYDEPTLIAVMFRSNKYYNFEYYMNREHVYNQQMSKGAYRCNCCKIPLLEGLRHCHHRNPRLPLDQVNKVKNLVWLCTSCHKHVEYGIEEESLKLLNKTTIKRIEKLRKILTDFGIRKQRK